MTIQQLRQRTDFAGKFYGFNTKANDSVSKIHSINYDFWIQPEKVLLVTRPNYHSLSFPVYRNVPSAKLENLFFHPYKGGYLPYLIRYDYDAKDLLNLEMGLPVADPISKIEIVPLYDFDMDGLGLPMATFGDPGDDYSGTYFRINGVCHTYLIGKDANGAVTYKKHPCPGCPCAEEGSGDGGTVSSGHGPLIYDLRYQFAAISIGEGGGGGSLPTGGGPQVPGTPSIFNPINGGGPSSGTGFGSGITDGPPAIGVVTPVTIPTPASEFYAGLSFYQKLILVNAGDNFMNTVVDFLTSNDYSEDSIDQVHWVLDYMLNTGIDGNKAANQFLGTSEGQDGEYDAYWDNPNLTFTQQNLPTWQAFESAFPKKSDPDYDTSEKMFNSIGGQVATYYSGPLTNTCAIRLSKALNYSGVIIPHIPGKTFKGADNKYYFKAAYEINIWMRKTFGTNPQTATTPYNANHYRYTGAQAGVHGVNLPGLLEGKKGIYSLYSSDFKGWASGHADLLNSDATCANNCHFYDAPIAHIDIWVLN